MNKSEDTCNSWETWKCYIPEYHYENTQNLIVIHVMYNEKKENISSNNL